MTAHPSSLRLLVAEKPSMARSIAQALGFGGRGDGFLEGPGVLVTWCIGHLVELAPPEVYDEKLERWSMATLPILPDEFRLVPAAKTRAQLRIVRDLLLRKDVAEVVNACDSGREGELIFDHVYRLAKCRKPVLRLWTASLTDDAIRTAYARLKPAAAYDGLRDAARSRSEADWLVGLNGTRAQTLVAQKSGQRGVWSLGRVQTPTLALVVERDRAIREFVAKDYFTVEARLGASAGDFEARWFRVEGDKTIDRHDRREDAAAVADRARPGPASVASVEGKDVRLPPERFYDLTTLQREANRRWGYSAKRTLDVAQALYEKHKLISYPRTASRHLTTDVAQTLAGLLAALARQGVYAAAITAVVPPRRLGPRFVDDSKVEDHHAILPTGKAPGRLDEAEGRVYDLVCRRLIAAFHPDRIEARTQVICDVGGERFRARGIVCTQPGWSAVDPPMASHRDGDRPLPRVTVGEPLAVHEVKVVPRKTQPPRPYTDAELLAAMETAGRTLDDEELRLAMRESGLGTPATRAAMIEHLLAREYLLRDKKTLRATARGVALIEGLPVAALKSPQLTGEWEAKLARMARREYGREAFMAEIATYTRELVGQIAAGPAPDLPAPPPPPPRKGAPPAKDCACGKPARAIYSPGKKQWFQRCDACDRWL